MTLNPALRQTNKISPDELASALAAGEDLVLLDVRHTPGQSGRKASYLAEHLPGARYIDLSTELADPQARQAGRGNNPLPDPAKLEGDLRRLGVNRTSSVIVYDDTNGAPAARAWWVLTWAGLGGVRVLDGGLTAWKAAGHPLAEGEVVAGSSGDVRLQIGRLPFLHIDEAGAFPRVGTLVDVRPAAYFSGDGKGHIPGAKSFPVQLLLRSDNRLVSGPELIEKLQAADVDIAKPVAAYCGGGVASTLFTLALAEIGKEVALYPGSWSEWTADNSRPVER